MTDSDRYLSDFNQRLECARLLHATPECVFEAFRKAADNGRRFFCDRDVELALLSRNDPQINLALAAYGENSTVVCALYQAGAPRTGPTLKERLRDGSIKAALLALNDPYINSRLAVDWNDPSVAEAMLEGLYEHSPLYLRDASLDAQYKRELRHACLSNRRACWPFSISGLLDALSRNGEDLVTSLLAAEGDGRDDLATLMTNPTVGEEVLADLFKHTGTFKTVDDNAWRRLVFWASDNPRLAEPEKDSNEGPDMAAWHIREGIECLLNTEPPADDSERNDWAWAVRNVLETAHESLRPDSVNTQQIFAKWPTARPRKDSGEGEGDDRWMSISSDSRSEQRALCYLVAALFGTGFAADESTEKAPDDWMAQLRRCAHYGKGHLSVKDLDNGYAKDGNAFVVAVLCNDDVLIDDSLRRRLVLVCNLRWWGSRWRARYEERCRVLQKDHPRIQVDTPDPAEENRESPHTLPHTTPVSPDDLSKSLARSLESFKRWVVIGFIVVILILLFRR